MRDVRYALLPSTTGLLVLVVLGSMPSTATAQGAPPTGKLIRTAVQVPPVDPNQPKKVVTIGVDNTGVASWDFRNARNPPRVWDRVDPAPEAFRLPFVNDTSGATVRITLPAVTVPFVVMAADGRPFNPTSLLGFDANEARAEARRLLNASLTGADLAAASAVTESDLDAQARIGCIAKFLKAESGANESRLDQTNIKTARDQIATVRGPVSLSLNQGECAVTTEDARAALRVFRTTFPRRASARAAVAVEAGIHALEWALAAVDDLKNLQSSVSPSDPTPAERAEKIFGVRLTGCEAKDTEVVCTPSLTLAPNAEGWIDGRLIVQYPANGVIRFKVSFPFALESDQPPAAFGYFSLDAELRESPSTVTWTASGSLSFSRDPYYGSSGQIVEADRRYEDQRTRQVKGTGRMAMAYALGNLASGFVELQFKNSMLGRKDEDYPVKVNQYNFQAFGFSGLNLKFGKYLFAAPSDGLAINESGEGVSLRYRWLGVSHILKREGAAGAADPNDDDHKVWLADVSNIAIPGEFMRSLSFYGLYGMDDTPDRERRYHTFGTELLFGDPKSVLTGSAAFYLSESNPQGDSGARPADGSALFVRVAKSWLLENKPARTIVGTFARGSGDNRSTPDRFDGYLGESAGFGPDGTHFLSAVVPRVQLEPVMFYVVDKAGNLVLDSNGKPQPEFLERGLSNRSFIGLAYSDQTKSPLAWLPWIFRPTRKEIVSQQTTFRVNWYVPTEQVLGTREASWEIQAEFLLEAPKGVKYIVRAGRVFPRGPLEALFPQEPYQLLAQCNISLK